jgi:hypothetical protein
MGFAQIFVPIHCAVPRRCVREEIQIAIAVKIPGHGDAGRERRCFNWMQSKASGTISIFNPIQAHFCSRDEVKVFVAVQIGHLDDTFCPRLGKDVLTE